IRSAGKLSAKAKKVEEPAILSELFDDLPTESSNKHQPDLFAPALEKAKVRDQAARDPFAEMGELDASKLPPVGEATSFFIAQAGVNKRNPPWKIALFVAAIVGLPMLTLYLLSEQFKVVPLKITKIDEATGEEVEHTVFSAEGVSGLGDLLMGKSKKPEKVAKAGRPARRANPAASPDSTAPTDAKPGPSPVELKEEAAKKSATGPSAQDLSALYGDVNKKDVGPKVRKGEQAKAQDTSVGGLAEADVARVVGQTQPAFQSCIEQELRKNPNFKGGKVSIVATVATSGVVTKAQIDRNDIDRSGLGDCLKGRAKRMIFSSFAGEETDVQIPLILGSTL
ncbi:MAG: AgmX/PglI C-terminal domain-containing protein, partial [Myxococcaceae bacterium]